jgi:hypothetical protein
MRNEMQFNVGSHAAETPLVSLASFGRGIGRTPVTLWRWQKLGWLDASVNIAGKPYLTREAVDRFARRAAAGEFSKAHHAPRREKGIGV